MKKFINIILVILCVLSLCGCHGSAGKKEFVMPEEFDTTKNYEITFWAKNDTNVNQVRVYEKAIKDFEELYPNIKVNLKLYTDYSRIYNDVITNISTNTTPNICITYPDHIATYITGNNTVVDLDTLVDDENYGLGGKMLKFDAPKKDELVKEFYDEGKIDGKQYALPFMRSTEALYINETYVNKLGYEVPDVLTWDFIFEVSKEALRKNEDGTYFLNNQNIMIPFIYKSTDNMMISMLKQLNAPYSTEDGDIEIFNDTTTDILRYISSYTELKTFSTFKISSYPGNYFNAGQCIFAIDSTAGATWIGSNAPLLDIAKENVVDFKTVVRVIPQYDTSNLKMISQGPSICIFNKEDPNEVLASFIFSQFLLSNDVQISYSKTEGYVPVSLLAQNSAEYLDYLDKAGIDDNEHYDIKIEASKLLIENTENTFVTPVFNGSASLRTAAGTLIEEVVKSTNINVKIDDAYIDKLYKAINSLYRLDQCSKVSSKDDLGPLPSGSKALLISLGVVWASILTYFTIKKFKKN